MPYLFQIKIECGKNLPVMDRQSNSTDSFVEVRYGQETSFKTKVCWRTLDPIWSSDWYCINVKQSELFAESIILRVFDHDSYTAHNRIGQVTIPLFPIIHFAGADSNLVFSGWLPLSDTMADKNRGFIFVVIKVDDFSGGMAVQSGGFPSLHLNFGVFLRNDVRRNLEGLAVEFRGVLCEIVIEEDTEYQWIDVIRSSRKSNYIREKLITKLLRQAKHGLIERAKQVGSNALFDYNSSIDFISISSHKIVVKATGIAVYLCERGAGYVEGFDSRRNYEFNSLFDGLAEKTVSLDPYMPSVDTVFACIDRDNYLLKSPRIVGMSMSEESFSIQNLVVSISLHQINASENSEIVQFAKLCIFKCRGQLKKTSYVENSKNENATNSENSTTNKETEVEQVLAGYAEETSFFDKYFLVYNYATNVLVHKKITENDEESNCGYFHVAGDKSESGFYKKCRCCSNKDQNYYVPNVVMATIDIPGVFANNKSVLVTTSTSLSLNEKEWDSVSEDNQIFNDCVNKASVALHQKLYKKCLLSNINAVFNIKLEVSIKEGTLVLLISGDGYNLNVLYQNDLELKQIVQNNVYASFDDEKKDALQKKIDDYNQKNYLFEQKEEFKANKKTNLSKYEVNNLDLLLNYIPEHCEFYRKAVVTDRQVNCVYFSFEFVNIQKYMEEDYFYLDQAVYSMLRYVDYKCEKENDRKKMSNLFIKVVPVHNESRETTTMTIDRLANNTVDSNVFQVKQSVKEFIFILQAQNSFLRSSTNICHVEFCFIREVGNLSKKNMKEETGRFLTNFFNDSYNYVVSYCNCIPNCEILDILLTNLNFYRVYSNRLYAIIVLQLNLV